MVSGSLHTALNEDAILSIAEHIVSDGAASDLLPLIQANKTLYNLASHLLHQQNVISLVATYFRLFVTYCHLLQ